ncbi:MAG: roadblock/LC7 domain-containing protein [Promethearchaeota archaeon]
MTEIYNNLVNILDDLIINTGAKNALLITEDGIVIAGNSQQNDNNHEVNYNFAAISASILSMAERGIEIINSNKILEQIKIDAGMDENLDQDFSILITRVISNILIQLIFPKTINIGLIQFEVNNTIKKIKDIIKKDTSRALFTNIGSLL